MLNYSLQYFLLPENRMMQLSLYKIAQFIVILKKKSNTLHGSITPFWFCSTIQNVYLMKQKFKTTCKFINLKAKQAISSLNDVPSDMCSGIYFIQTAR